MNKYRKIQPLFTVSKTVTVVATTMWVFNSPILAQDYGYDIFSPSFSIFDIPRSCEPRLQETVACRLEVAMIDRLEYSSFAQAVESSRIMKDLSQSNSDRDIEFTLLVPPNDALPENVWESLQERENKDELERFVKSHIVRGKIGEAEINKGEVRALAENLIQVRDVSETGVTFIGENGEEIKVQTNDEGGDRKIIHAGNGVLIFIDRVLVQPKL